MSTQFNTDPQSPVQPFPPMPDHPPVKQKAQRKWLVPVLMITALLVGIGFGSIKPAPAPVTIEKPVEKIVEKKVEVPVTPAVCGVALDKGAEVNDISAEVVRLLSSSLTAAGEMDAATIVANTAKVREQTQKLKDLTPTFQLSRDSCRASLK